MIFVFGDNLIGRGMKGQACIRTQSNAFGIPTKRLPSMNDDAFFSDRQDEIDAVLDALRALYKLKVSNKVCWPASGIGTGLAQMKFKSPVLFNQMNRIIELHFNNPYNR
ncbi:MAG: hypothetical protein QM500_04955 [Methylococcales bacterium]